MNTELSGSNGCAGPSWREAFSLHVQVSESGSGKWTTNYYSKEWHAEYDRFNLACFGEVKRVTLSQNTNDGPWLDQQNQPVSIIEPTKDVATAALTNMGKLFSEVDSQIVKLLVQRERHSRRVKWIKVFLGLPLERPDIEEIRLNTVEQTARELKYSNPAFIRRLFLAIIRQSKKVQIGDGESFKDKVTDV